jgi:hypothetical protein
MWTFSTCCQAVFVPKNTDIKVVVVPEERGAELLDNFFINHNIH